MTNAACSNTLARKFVWLVVIALILSLSWLKVAENRRGRASEQTRRQRLVALQIEASAKGERLVSWLRPLIHQPDAKQQIERRLSDGHSLPVTRHGGYDVATWRHPKYGTRLELTFDENNLVGMRVTYGVADVEAANPPPPQISKDGTAESIRKMIPRPAVAVWFMAALVAVMSKRLGRIAAEAMLAMALVCGAAWLVSPWYTITVHGVLSNDRLNFALLMYLASIVLLALRIPLQQARGRFHLRTLLAITAVIAALMVLGPVGFVAMGVLALGGPLFAGMLKLQAAFGGTGPDQPDFGMDGA